jgi:hypothetical protein
MPASAAELSSPFGGVGPHNRTRNYGAALLAFRGALPKLPATLSCRGELGRHSCHVSFENMVSQMQSPRDAGRLAHIDTPEADFDLLDDGILHRRARVCGTTRFVFAAFTRIDSLQSIAKIPRLIFLRVQMFKLSVGAP